MSLKVLYKTDPVANEAGVWVKYSKNTDGTIPRFKLARMHAAANKRYSKALDKATKPYRRELELETLDDQLSEDLMLDVFADTILLDWEHVQPNDDGVVLEFTKENVVKFLGDPEWAELYEDLQARAKKAALFRKAELEQAAKN